MIYVPGIKSTGLDAPDSVGWDPPAAPAVHLLSPLSEVLLSRLSWNGRTLHRDFTVQFLPFSSFFLILYSSNNGASLWIINYF